jgi:hypothetical protein
VKLREGTAEGEHLTEVGRRWGLGETAGVEVMGEREGGGMGGGRTGGKDTRVRGFDEADPMKTYDVPEKW